MSSGYRADLSDQKKRQKAMSMGRRAKLVGPLAKLVIELVKKDWSPEQISARLRREQGFKISHKTIYQMLKADRENGGQLYLLLRHGKRAGESVFTSLE